MKRNFWRWIATASCLWAGQANANGGGYSFGVTFTGSVAPFQAAGTEHVRIEDEQLDIALRRTSAAVAVRYTMRNQTPAPVRVRFGFPVEATRQEMGQCDFEPGKELDECLRKDLRDSIQQLRGYTLTADGAPVPAEYQIEPFATGKVKPFKGSEALKGIAGWMVSEVTFPPSQTLALEIGYSADYLGGGSSVSDDSWLEAGRFLYRLSTGAVWDGPIEKSTITVRADGIAAEDVQILRGHLTRSGDTWVRHFERLEPTLDDDIEIIAIPSYYVPGSFAHTTETDRYAQLLQRGGDQHGGAGRWGGAHQRFTAKASSTLRAAKDHDFGPQHLAEDRAAYPWCEGAVGLGIGEWVELTPATPRPLLALAVAPGFQRPKLYQQNGRPTRVEITLDGAARFEATLGEVDVGGLTSGSQGVQLIPILGYDRPVKKLRVTLLEATPGTRYEDTCIQKIVLYDRLEKAPETAGAR